MPNIIAKFFLKAIPVLGIMACGMAVYGQQPKPKAQQNTTIPAIDPTIVTPDQVQQVIDKKTEEIDPYQINKDEKEKEKEDATVTESDDDKDKKNIKSKKDNAGVGLPGGLPIFGNEIFNKGASTFAPETNRPIPINYVLGPGDNLNIAVTGNSVTSFNPTVMPDGAISLREMGKVYIGGRTIENATLIIKDKLRANRFAVDRGTNVDVSITNIRTIHISILGAVATPGDYNVSSLTSVFNALYLSGGITNNGSFRAVKVIRNNELIQQIDMYDYLTRGDLSGNISLKDGDIIMVPLYNVRVSIAGEVKRPAYFEVLPGETFADVLKFAGGFTDYAYRFSIKAIQVTDKQQRIKDIERNEFENYIPLKADRYVVSRILNKVENRVTIAGSVYRPGDYELTDGLTLAALIKKADGVKEDVYLERGYITRQKEDNSSEIIPFYLKGILDGTAEDILLHKEDVVQLSSIFDYSDAFTVSINGKVRSPGTFPYYNGMTVEDLVLKGRGFAEGANMIEVEIARRVTNSDLTQKDAKLANLIKVIVDPELKLADSKFKLQPFDVVSVFALPGYVKTQMVTIEGEVMNPGTYAMLTKDESISDLVKRANGFTAFAYLPGASLKRADVVETQSDIEQQQYKLNLLKKRQLESIDSTSINFDLNDMTKRNDLVGINLSYILEHPKSDRDLILLNGDILNVPRALQTVKISGEVYSPKTVVFTKKLSLKEYVLRSGGFTENAKSSKAYVVYANGDNKGTRRFLFFRNYPEIEPGAEIFIPREKPKVKKDGTAILQTWIGLTTSLVSMVAIIYSVSKSN